MALVAQPARGLYPSFNSAWWDSPVAQNLHLTDAQTKQIRATVKEYRDRIVDLRATVEKAEGDLDDVFNENPVDQRKANDAIDRLATARGELTKNLSQMSLKLRSVLTTEQWQELQRRQPGRSGPNGRRRVPGARPGPPPGAPDSSQKDGAQK